jgi:hypothetical protein
MASLLDKYINPSLTQPIVTPQTFVPTNLTSSKTFANPVPITSLGNTMNPTGIPQKTDMTQQYNQATAGATAGALTPAGTYPTPNGAIVDVNGTVITPAKQTSPDTSTTVVQDQPWYKDLLNKVMNRPEPTSSVEQYNTLAEQQGLTKTQQEVNDLTAQLNAMSAETQASQLSTVGQGRGIPQAIIGGQQTQLERERAIRALPISAALNAAQGRLSAAQDNINTILTLTQKDNEAKYQYQKDQINYALQFADAEQKAQLEERKAQLDAEKANMEQFNKTTQTYINAAISAGDYKTAGALAAAQNYDELSRLANEIKNVNQDLQFISGTDNQPSGYFNKKTGTFTSLGGKTTPSTTVSGLSPEQSSDPFIGKLLSTKGGKPLTDTSIQKIDKGLTVLGQLGVLQTNIKDVSTGPIVGLFKGKNPWDTNAQTIKAQLNAIVPNLARGVYGEVGVLTDNDIKTYAQTLPNLTSTEDVRNAVLGITIDLIGKSIKRTLEVNAANGKDVSGFVDLYTEMQNTKDSIFKQLSGNIEGTDVFDSVVKTPESSSWMTNLWNSLF